MPKSQEKPPILKIRGLNAGNLLVDICHRRFHSKAVSSNRNHSRPCRFRHIGLANGGAERQSHIQVPTLEGKVTLTIPAGVQSGTKFRMKGKGVKNIKGYGKGDQYVTIKVVTPKNLTAEQRNLLEQLRATLSVPATAETGFEGKKKESAEY